LDYAGSCGVLVLVVFMVFGSYVSAKNQMVAKDQNVKAAWSEVDVQLERRADLIPNLVETVKGFTKEESTVFGDIANARAGMLNAQGPAAKIAANGQLDGALGRLLLLTENYPQLRSSEQFMRLQDELAGPRTASAWPASATTTRCRTTTRSSCSSPTASGRGWPATRRTTPTLRPARRRKAVPSVKF
jgi:LemA protein